MADVDFSSAIIEPANLTNWKNPTLYANVCLSQKNKSNKLWNSSGTAIASGSQSVVVNETNQLVYLYNGTFSASGTEFYIEGYDSSYGTAGWKVSNVSFANGDTYTFTINATLTCN